MKRHIAAGTLLATTVRDELLRHVESAVKAIRLPNPSDAQIHAARKELKRARANLRLVRNIVGKKAYSRENVALRDAARPLSGVRDAAVLRETVDKLITTARRGSHRRLIFTIRRALERARLEARAELLMMNATKASAACLKAAAARIRKWPLDHADIKSVYDGLKRIYRRGREAYAIACGHPTSENLHEWRKQVKYLGHSMEMWKEHQADGVKGLIKRVDKLADLLGSDHDLVVLEERLKHLASPHPIRPSITRDIAKRRRDLLDNALKTGRRLFKEKPRSFVREITRQR
jgi:CHAD domain-containing protein